MEEITLANAELILRLAIHDAQQASNFVAEKRQELKDAKERLRLAESQERDMLAKIPLAEMARTQAFIAEKQQKKPYLRP